MAQPTYVTSGVVGASTALLGSTFGTTLAVQIDLGTSGDVSLAVLAYVNAGTNLVMATHVTVGGTMSGGTDSTNSEGQAINRNGTISGGTDLTLEAQTTSFLGIPGVARGARAVGLTLTGLQWVQMRCGLISDGTPEPNGKPTLICIAYSGASAIAAGTTFAVNSASPSQSVTTTADDVALMLAYTSVGDTRPVTATSPTVQRVTGLAAQAQGLNSFAWDEPGVAGTTTLQGAIGGTGSTPGYAGVKWVVQGTAGGTAPTIDAQPTAQTVTAPTAATFTASVGGTFTGLRWQRQAAGAGAWADVSGATSTTLTTGATSVTGGSWNNTDRVRLAVDWSGGTVLSNDVALTVNAAGTAPSITTQPSNASVTVGSTAGFTVAATGSGTLTYQWQREPAAGGGFTNISGATSASYTTPATSISGGSANNGDKYRCVVTGDTSPPATSNQATLTVLQPLATTITFTITGATSLTGLKWAVFEGLTPDAWVAPIAKGAAESTNASDVCTVSIAGVTTKRVGDLACVVVTNSDGTATGGSQAATRRFAYYIGVCA